MISRRKLTVSLAQAGLLLGVPLPSAPAHAAAPVKEHTARTFAAFLDTLIPADEHSPAASALAIDQTILQLYSDKPNALGFIEGGCNWLDQQTFMKFASLPEASRESIVAKMADATPESPERIFFDQWRRDAMRLYYSQPQSWRAMGFDRPPQPLGYLEHAKPPKADA